MKTYSFLFLFFVFLKKIENRNFLKKKFGILEILEMEFFLKKISLEFWKI